MELSKLLIVEDDKIQADWLQESLQIHFPKCELQRIGTAREFGQWLEREPKNIPSAVIMDIMLVYELPSRDMDPVDSHVSSSFDAGLTCIRNLRACEALAGVPVVAYTVLLESDLRPALNGYSNVEYVEKADITTLVKRLMAFRAPQSDHAS